MSENKPFTFYAKDVQVKSFFDEKSHKQRYMVGGYISTGDLDLVNDIATEDCRKDLSAQFKGRNIKLDLDHETIRADRTQTEFDARLNLTKPVLGKAISEDNDGTGNMVWFELNTNWKKFDPSGNVTMDFKSVWEDIQNGFYDAFSIAYVPEKTRMLMKGDSQIRLLDKVNLINVALTGNPVNPAARMMDFKTVMAKSLAYLKDKEDEQMNDEMKKLDYIENELAEVKAKYVRRWRGRDGKYQYDYGNGGSKQRTSKESWSEIRKKRKESLKIDAANAHAKLLAHEGNSQSEIAKELVDRYEIKPEDARDIAKGASPSKESGSKQSSKESSLISPKEEGKIKEMRKIANDVDNSDLQGIAMTTASDILNLSPSEAMSNKESRKRYSDAQDVLLNYAHGEVELNKAKEQLSKLKQNSGTSSTDNKPKWKSHSQEPNGGIMMENNLKPEATPDMELQAKGNVKQDENEKEEDEEIPAPEGKSVEFDAKSFAEMKSDIEALKKENAEMKSVLEEARVSGKGAENNAEKQAKSQNTMQIKGVLDLI